MQQNCPVEVFCCYARKDTELLCELQAHLSSLQRQEIIKVRCDGDVSAGKEWDQEIKKFLNNANIILLLISSDFIHSDYCYSTEMQHSLERHKQKETRVIPVILRPVSGWEKVPHGDLQLGQLQALPKDAKPVISWANRDEVWQEIVQGIEKVAHELLLRPSVASVQPGSTRDKLSILQHLVPAGLGARVRLNVRNKNRRSRGTKTHVFQLLLVFTLVMLVIASFTNPDNITSSFIRRLFYSGGGDPVRIDSVSAQYMDDTHVFANALVLSDSALSQLNSLYRDDPSYEDWFASRHAVNDTSRTLLVLEGNRDHTVRIIGMQPIVSCQSPLSGTLFYSPSEGGDRSTELGFDLDNPQAPPSYALLNQNGTITSGTGFFGTYTVSLNLGEQFTFLVVASTKKQFCKFTLMMTVVDGDKTVRETITNNGQPFQVTALLPYGYVPEFSDYPVLYIGGILSTGSPWSRADPKTYNVP